MHMLDWVCMHVIYLPVPTSFAAAVAVSPFPPLPEAHPKQLLQVEDRNIIHNLFTDR